MSGNIRKQLGPIRKRLRDRTKEALEVSTRFDLPKLRELRGKLLANINSHDNTYLKLDELDEDALTVEEKAVVDSERETSVELSMDANEARQYLDACIAELQDTPVTSSSVQDREAERLEREIEKLKVETEYRRTKLEKLKDSSGEKLQKTVKLPVLKLPTFSGKIIEWPTFWDSFKSTVHSNESLSRIDKFKYLLSLLKGEAKDTVRGFNLAEDHYEQAIAQLKERFDDKEQIIHNHYIMLSNIQKCTNTTQDLRKTFNFLEAQIRSLVALGENVDNNHIISLMKSKFPGEINRRIEETHDGVWTLAVLRKSIGKLIIAREKSENDVTQFTDDHEQFEYTGEGLLSKDVRMKCSFCGRNHWSDECQQFKSVEERKSRIRGRCFICLSNKHLYRECTNEKACFYCKRKRNHHSALCPNKFGVQQEEEEEELVEVGEEKDINLKKEVMMKTARVEVWNLENGQRKTVTALLDTGAKRTYVSKAIADILQLDAGPPKLIKLNTFGCTNSSDMYTSSTRLGIKQNDSSKLKIDAKICETITGDMVKQRIDVAKYKHIWGELNMADDLIGKRKIVKIDLLIGNDYYEDIIKNERIKVDDGLYLVNSTLGWVFSGRITSKNNSNDEHLMLVEEKDDITSRFWDLETIGIQGPFEEIDSNKFMNRFASKLQMLDGRYHVSWPWKLSKYELPDNRILARARLKSLVSNLNKDEKLMNNYDEIIQKQLNSKVIEKIDGNIDNGECFVKHYLPHHMVLKNDDPAKLRIVYEGCAKLYASQKSLNECLYRGPNLVKGLCGILLRFRLKKVAIIADIEKAYLQLGLNQEDRDVIRFLWLKDINRPFSENNIQEYRFCRVIWGIASSAFLLAATISNHLAEVDTPFSRDISKNLYVDNLITSLHTIDESISYYKECKDIFNKISMNMCKWISNDEEVMKGIEKADRSDEKITKTLGMMWNVETDELALVKNTSHDIPDIITKRYVLQRIASVYDPLGLLSPVMVKPKLLIQELWKRNFDWDSQVPDDIAESWKTLECELRKLHTIHVRRCIDEVVEGEGSKEYEIIVFADASKVAYAAVGYLKTYGGKNVTTNLIFAKTRLAPIKTTLTVPRLELLGVVTACRISKFLVDELHLELSRPVKIFTDAVCVLEWCKSSKHLKKFILDRVNEIKSHDVVLNYVKSEDNPADVATKGCTVEGLKANKLWWNGPDWLLSCDEMPSVQYELNEQVKAVVEQEAKKDNRAFEIGLVAESHSSPLGPFAINEENFSRLSRLVRVTAWCQRFVDNVKTNRRVDVLSPQELLESAEMWTRYIQEKYFRDVLEAIDAGKKNTIKRQLGLYKDDKGILRCGGRFLLTKTHPKLLPKDSHFTKLVIVAVHRRNLHVGVSQVLADVRNDYWIIQGRSAVRKVIRNCLICIHWEGGPFKTPPFAPFPVFKTSCDEPPFTHTGIDYLGPLQVKDDTDILKNWVCLFTCLNVRAIHLELIENMSCESFLLCLRRFIGRRGAPKLIISDNASQLILGSSVIDTLWKTVTNNTDVQSYVANISINWKNIVQYAPWKGGFYERMVGIVKRSLRKSLGVKKLNREEFLTVLVETESIINSRPLVYVGDDINSTDAITPAHFLTLNYKTVFPTWDNDIGDAAYKETSAEKILSTWRKGQILLNEFWKIWSSEYLHALRERKVIEMKRTKGDIDRKPRCGEVVLIKQEGLKRGTWKLGKVVNLIKGDVDDVERAATLLTKNGKLIHRPFCYLYPLELDEEPKPQESQQNVIMPRVNTVQQSQPDLPERRPKRKAAISAKEKIKYLQ